MDVHSKLVHSKLREGFHRISRRERLARLQTFCGLTDAEVEILAGDSPVRPEIAEHLIENVVGYFPIPLGIATHFKIDGRPIMIPMAVEETSIIAAASATAKWVSHEGSLRTHVQGRLIIGQIQIPRIVGADKIKTAVSALQQAREELINLANSFVPSLVARGGGIQDLCLRELVRPDGSGSMLVIHVLCDPCDAMGANLINQVCEGLKPEIENLTGYKVGLCILSNLVDGRVAVAEATIRNIDPVVGRGISEASLFATADPYRAATHNKGVLNGIDPILIATGNDWRAVEAGIHAYASRTGSYQPVTTWRLDGNDLVGRFEAPLAVGTVGGVTQVHPLAKIALKILGITQSDELARICAAVGLVQNLGALKALATVGIVKGHMQLHATNLALAAGAELHEVPQMKARLAEVLRVEKRINLSRAKEILEAVRVAQRGTLSV